MTVQPVLPAPSAMARAKAHAFTIFCNGMVLLPRLWLLASPFPGSILCGKSLRVTDSRFDALNTGKSRLARDHFVDQFPVTVDLDADLVAGLEEFAARHAYARRCAGGVTSPGLSVI